MKKDETVFMFDYDIKEMEFYCANDDKYESRFVDENGETYSFNASRARVMEHVRWFAPNPEHYIENKDLVVEHFRRMAMASYAMSHFPKAIKKTMKEHHISTYER